MSEASGMQDEAEGLDFFTTQFKSADDARQYMEKNGFKEGQYLLRPSNSNKNQLAISVVVRGGKIVHLNVRYDSHGAFFLAPELRFRSLEALFDHYSRHDISNSEKIHKVRLLNPIPCLMRRKRTVTHPIARGPPSLIHSSSGASATSASSHPKVRSVSESCGVSARHNQPFLPDPNFHAQQPRQTDKHPPHNSPPNSLPRGQSYIQIPGASGYDPHFTRRAPPGHDPNANRPLPDLPPPPVFKDLPADYSRARALEEKIQINFVNPKTENLCKCGLRADTVELPLGWTVHLSSANEEGSRPCLFFQSTKNETSWVLPPNITELLNETQREVLKELARNYRHADNDSCFT